MPPKAADGRRPSPDGGLGGFVPFPADRAASYRAAGYWSGRTLDTVLSDAARRWIRRFCCRVMVQRIRSGRWRGWCKRPPRFGGA